MDTEKVQQQFWERFFGKVSKHGKNETK